MKYSFIIPVYNSIDYIEKCVMSIINQKTKSKYEIIIIDDGSTDLVETKVQELISKYPQIIKYYKQTNQGVSVARNEGLNKSNGKYIILVDSDDEIPDDFFEHCDQIKNIEAFDVIKTRVECIENKKYDNRFELPVFNELSGSNALNVFCKSNNIFATPWSYIFKRDFIIKEKLYFKKNTTHEDYGLIPIIISKAIKIKSVDWYGYKYIKRENSMSTTTDDKNEIIRINDFIKHTYELIKYFNSKSYTASNYFYNRMKIKIDNLNLNIRLNMNYKVLDKIESIINKLDSSIFDLPKEYLENVEKALNDIKDIFKSDLLCVVLGGSCGKNNPIIGWSDIDLYVILKSYNFKKVKKFNNLIANYELHIGVTYYTLREIESNMIDNKTKIMLYEKQHLRVNPTLYGYCSFKEIKYEEVVLKDKNNLPNVMHEFRRMYTKILNNENKLDKKYFKKLLVLIKCYLNINNVFIYGYDRVVLEFLKIYNQKKQLTKLYYFDIIKSLNNIQNNEKATIIFTENVLNFILDEMEEF